MTGERHPIDPVLRADVFRLVNTWWRARREAALRVSRAVYRAADDRRCFFLFDEVTATTTAIAPTPTHDACGGILLVEEVDRLALARELHALDTQARVGLPVKDADSCW